MNPLKYGQFLKWLTRDKSLEKLYKEGKLFPASEAPIPKKTIERNMFKEAEERFNQPKEGVIQSAFDTATREAQMGNYPAPKYETFRARYLRNLNKKEDGGMLVKPSADGSRSGYKEDYITPAKRKKGDPGSFKGQKFISVPDESYSDGRKRVKTPEYQAYLKKEIAKSKKRFDYANKGFIRREDGLLRIADAMQQADINDDAEFMMPNKAAQKANEKNLGRKLKVFKKGMLNASDIVYINNLEKNIDDVIYIADRLGESPDWVLDMLDERTNFRDMSRLEKDVLKKDPKYTKPRNDYLKVENWVQRNAKRYANPETFEKALINRFGNKNQFIKDMKSNSNQVRAYFSDDFKKLMLNTNPKSYNKSSQLKQFITSSLYNFNPKIKQAVTQEIKNIFNSENLPKLRTEARKLLNENKLLSKFGLNKAITGPYAKIIQAEIGQDLWNNITNFRQHRIGTQEMLKAFEQLVSDEFKPMFNEAAKAISYSKNNEWKKAKESLGIADNIAWDHKVPSSVIDKGYADIVEYTKVNPTTSNFNERIKNAQFDRPINKLITQYEKAKTLDQKVKVVDKMNLLKDNFNKKYDNYLEEVSINIDDKGKLNFSSSADPLSMKANRVEMLEKSLRQEKAPRLNLKSQRGFATVDALLSPYKAIGKGFMKAGGPFEAGFYGLDFMNELSKGLPADSANQIALNNITFGLLGDPDKFRMRDLVEAGNELGVTNTGAFQQLKNLIDLEKQIIEQRAYVDEFKTYNEMAGGKDKLTPKLDVFSQSSKLNKLEGEYQRALKQFQSLENPQQIAEDYFNSIQFLGRKEYNKVIDTKKNQVYPNMGTMGSNFVSTVLNPTTFLPQNLMESGLGPFNLVTRPVVRTIRKIPGIGQFFDPTSPAAKLSAMSEEEKQQRAIDLNIVPQNVQPGIGQTMTDEQLESYYSQFLSEGGVASGPPPKRGPDPQGQGLLSLIKNAKNY